MEPVNEMSVEDLRSELRRLELSEPSPDVESRFEEVANELSRRGEPS